jgi:hypothetical protein
MHTHLLVIKKPLAGAVSHFALLHFTIRYTTQAGGHFKSQRANMPRESRPPRCIYVAKRFRLLPTWQKLPNNESQKISDGSHPLPCLRVSTPDSDVGEATVRARRG